jgi:hypothetical protein
MTDKIDSPILGKVILDVKSGNWDSTVTINQFQSVKIHLYLSKLEIQEKIRDAELRISFIRANWNSLINKVAHFCIKNAIEWNDLEKENEVKHPEYWEETSKWVIEEEITIDSFKNYISINNIMIFEDSTQINLNTDRIMDGHLILGAFNLDWSLIHAHISV